MKTPIVTLALLAAAATAVAGTRNNVSSVVVGPGYASGALATARASSDSTQYIECQRFASTTYRVATCYARDAGGKSAMCTSTSPTIIAEASAIKGDSYLEFEWDASGNCTVLRVIDSSQFAPKGP
jgi:hypothetical protein